MFVSTLANLRLVNATVAAVVSNTFLLSRMGTLDDGAAGAFFWNSTDTRADDDGCIICPTGYAGTGRWNRIITDFISLNWYATYGTSAGDTSPSLRAAIAAAQAFNIRRITFNGQLWFATQICNAAEYSVSVGWVQDGFATSG